ncbi:MAG: DNA topoisomerase, partial [Verrucomicrobiota bacterium]|nr:DNA topoisomerase [Verrucomicrobiota bacterium]
EKDTFLTNGKTLTNPGWLAVYGRVAGVAAGKDELVGVDEGETARIPDLPIMREIAEGEELPAPIRVEDKSTKPPARYTESTLLAAMEGAGKLIDDDELREAMSERGLGTPATRAATIEGLLRQKYIAREGRDLNVSGKGLRLIELCEEMDIKALSSPSMTGDWEAQLNKMEKGEICRDVFMQGINQFTEDVVEKARSHMQMLVNRVFPDLE